MSNYKLIQCFSKLSVKGLNKEVEKIGKRIEKCRSNLKKAKLSKDSNKIKLAELELELEINNLKLLNGDESVRDKINKLQSKISKLVN